jgi:1-acyl-sn-glycerol-3-phosphate acyltransferase
MLDVIRTQVIADPVERLRGLVFWLGTAAITVVIGIPALVAVALDRGDTAMHFFQRRWGRLLLLWLRLLGVRIEFRGLHHLPRDRSSILVSNHQSMLDIFALSAVQPPHTRWVVKRELGVVPIAGWAMHLAGFVFVDRRGVGASVRRSFEDTEHILGTREGPMHLLFFAEGTRTRDGRLGAFKRGAFRMAADWKLPIVPIAIQGAFPLMVRSWVARLRSGRIRIRVLPPIDPDQFAPWSDEVLRDETRWRIARALGAPRPRGTAGGEMGTGDGGPLPVP